LNLGTQASATLTTHDDGFDSANSAFGTKKIYMPCDNKRHHFESAERSAALIKIDSIQASF